MNLKTNKMFENFQKGGIGAGSLYVAAIMLMIVGFSAALTNGVNPPTNTPTGAAVTIVPPNPETDKKNLQLYTFGYTTPAPTPTPPPVVATPTPPTTLTCATQIKPASCTKCTHGDSMICKESEAVCGTGIYNPFGWYEPPYTCAYIELVNKPLYDQKKNDPNCVEACIAKPVIYLYPTIATLVDVKLTIPGKVYISDPLYPEEGWKNVLAHPDGSLIYKNKNYKELYYESDVDKVNAPDNGIVINKKNLRKELGDIVSKLGLNDVEKKEFLEYWLPELDKLQDPYILFSVLNTSEKERVDHVDIYPQPDTFIGFIAYFKPLKSPPLNLNPLILPENPQARIGFTAVEWGGTIAN